MYSVKCGVWRAISQSGYVWKAYKQKLVDIKLHASKRENMVDQVWFEMADIRRRKLNNSVWVPLRSALTDESHIKYGYVGYKEEFFGSGCIAVPNDMRDHADKLEWTDIGINHHHSGLVENDQYIPSDLYIDYSSELIGLHLVLDQYFNSHDVYEWHLHQDIVVTLGLKREDDLWVCPNEDYIEVARLKRKNDGSPCILDIRSQFLKDYLCVRDYGLYVTSFRSREAVVDDASFINWPDKSHAVSENGDRWEGRVTEIHEGGELFGGKMSVFHMARTDVDESDDIPDISSPPTGDNVTSNSWERSYEGRKLFRVFGELWRNEWVEPAKLSTRIRGDKTSASVYFIINEEGTQECGSSLIKSKRWLWFKPDVIMALYHRRGGALGWHTQNTGYVGCSPDNNVHFGVNDIGLVNVYAKDVGLLPEWQQQIWAGYNVSPEGGVSGELLASQVRANPASTQAPEEFLKIGVEQINKYAQKNINITLFRMHESVPDLLKKTHRFRAIDEAGLYALAKDITRLIVDNLDAAAMHTVVSPTEKTKWGSLKSLEKLLASKIDSEKARSMISSLVGIYELRHADAHLPSSKIEEAFDLLNIDRKLPFVHQGHKMLYSCVNSIYGVVEVMRKWNDLGSQ